MCCYLHFQIWTLASRIQWDKHTQELGLPVYSALLTVWFSSALANNTFYLMGLHNAALQCVVILFLTFSKYIYGLLTWMFVEFILKNKTNTRWGEDSDHSFVHQPSQDRKHSTNYTSHLLNVKYLIAPLRKICVIVTFISLQHLLFTLLCIISIIFCDIMELQAM